MSSFFIITTVLIDTWWNVNITMHIVHLKVFISFNRYMVECELRTDGCNIIANQRFNRYMVECEWLRFQRRQSPVYRVLIDTWWNVNVSAGDQNKRCIWF